MKEMKEIFTKSTIAGIEFKNKIIRSATFERLSDRDGRPTEKLGDMYLKLAKGGVGAIITGLIAVHRNGRSSSGMCMIDRDDFIDDYKKINNMLNEYGVPLIAQLAHGGGQSDTNESGGFNLAPSKKKYIATGKFSQVLSEDEIQVIIDSYIDAIERSKKAGFAGVQLHAAHGYLLSEFLSGGLNSRKDKWGGSDVNRFRIISEIMKGARERIGDYPIMAKFSAQDRLKNGIRMDEALRLAVMFQEAGIDALEVSCGANDGFNTIRTRKIPVDMIMSGKFSVKIKSKIMKSLMKKLIPLMVKRYDPVYNFNVEAAEKIKQKIDIPVIVVGGIRNINDINLFITGGKADFVSMSRPFIIEPDLVNKFKEGGQESSRCIECCHCMFGKGPLRCYYGKVPEL